MGQRIVYQVINLTREEMFFGTTDLALEEELKRLASDPSGPAGSWAQGDVVHWRALTEPLDEATASSVHQDLESRPKPNNFRVIPTHPRSDQA